MPKDEFTTRRLHRCSFCYKTQDQVRRLVAGPDVYICDECIKLCGKCSSIRILCNSESCIHK